MSTLRRRSFVKLTAAGALAAGAGPVVWGGTTNAVGANRRIRLGIVGIRSHGFAHLREFAGLPDVEVAALCDVDERLFPERLRWLEENGKPKPVCHTDLRRLYEDKSIDAVSIVTPNHWHTLAAIWAIQAGKHVTAEKPCAHTYWEGRQLVVAARRYVRVIQHGTESRSNHA